MKVMMVLAGLSGNVMAEWTKVDRTDEYTNYVDFDRYLYSSYFKNIFDCPILVAMYSFTYRPLADIYSRFSNGNMPTESGQPF